MALTYDEDKVLNDLLSDYEFYREQVEILKRTIKREKKTVDTNGGKTLMQNPNIKTLNEFTKNMHSTLTQISKIVSADSEVAGNELLNFLQAKNK